MGHSGGLGLTLLHFVRAVCHGSLGRGGPPSASPMRYCLVGVPAFQRTQVLGCGTPVLVGMGAKLLARRKVGVVLLDSGWLGTAGGLQTRVLGAWVTGALLGEGLQAGAVALVAEVCSRGMCAMDARLGVPSVTFALDVGGMPVPVW